MRLLVMHWGRTNAGPRLTRELAVALSEQPELSVVLSYSLESDSVAEYERLRLPSFPLHTYRSMPTLALALLRAPWTALRLKRWMRREGVDAVLTTMFNPLQIAVLGLLRVPVVSCVHDAEAHAGDKGVYNVLLHLEVRRATFCVAFSSRVAGALRERFPNKSVLQTVHGTFSSRVTGDLVRRSVGSPVIGMFGRLGPYQGVEVLCRAAAILRDRLSFRVRVVGAGDDDTRRLRDAYPWIEWDLRWVPEEEADRIVASFDVVALPYREASQSGVLALALGLGVPVVATPVGGLVEQVNESRAGLLSADASPEAFAEALEVVVGDDKVRGELSRAARESASRVSWSRTAADIARRVAGIAS